MPDDLERWATGRAGELLARAEAEAVAELKAALLAAATAPPHAVMQAGQAAPPPSEPAVTASAEPTAPQPAGHALWAYCVARADAALEDGGPGVDPDGPVSWIRHGDLALLCSRVPLAGFAEEPLRRNLNDLAWLGRVARAHEAAIERALATTTIVPLRLCTIFAGEDAAKDMLAERAPALTQALDALEDKLEWSVKLLVEQERLEASLREPGAPEPAHDPGSGAAYMLVRREERRMREAAGRKAAELAEDVHARLQDWADDARVRPAQNRELSGHEGEMVLNGAYLVDRAKTAQLRELVDELQQRHAALGARLELGGPFPPYNFVPEPPA
jgi:hypothetical protein